MYAIFIQLKSKDRRVDHPCLDPLDYGIGNEPAHRQLLRRGRVAIFRTKQQAVDALKTSFYSKEFHKFAFTILECRMSTVEDE